MNHLNKTERIFYEQIYLGVKISLFQPFKKSDQVSIVYMLCALFTMFKG
jgi:hypothetical protein